MEEYKVQNQNAGKPEDKKKDVLTHLEVVYCYGFNKIQKITTESNYTWLLMETCSLR